MEKHEERRISLYEEDIYEKKEVKEEALSLMVFRLATEWYSVIIEKIKEVIKVEKLTYLPCAPDPIAGVVQLRGNILSVTDLKKLFGLPATEFTKKARLIIVYDEHLETGLLVDEVMGIVEVPLSKIDPPIATIAQEAAEYLEGECKMGRRLFGLLNVKQILRLKGVSSE